MTQHFPLDYGDVVHQGFFDPIQELLGASLPSLRIKVHDSTTLRITAGTGNDQVAAAIMGKYRFITSTVSASLGAISSGTASVYITASDNDFGGGPTGPPDVATNYGFGMEIKSGASTPTTALYRKVGEVDVSGGSIIAFRAMGGTRPSSEFTVVATPDIASQPGVLVKGLASQTGNLIEARDSTGTIVFSVGPTGTVTSPGAASSATSIAISGSGKTALNLSNTTANTGLTIGGDVEVYRAAADSIQTDDSLTIRRTTSTATTLATKVTSDSNDRVTITAGGEVQLGSGSASADVRIRRSGANAVTIDTPSAGAASLSVSGGLTVGTTLTLTQATTAGHIPISNGSGTMSLGTADTQSIANDAVTADKLRDDASTDSNRAVTTNHIRNGAVTKEKLATGVAIPAGVVSAYAGSTAPSGYLLCDGSAVSQATYQDLWVAIGTTYNTGSEGSGNFRLPDLRGRVAVGLGTNGDVNALGENEGQPTVSSRRPAHSHLATDLTTLSTSTATGGSHTHSTTAPQSLNKATDGQQNTTGGLNVLTNGTFLDGFTAIDGGTHSHTIPSLTVTGFVGQSGVADAPAFLTLNYIIKT